MKNLSLKIKMLNYILEHQAAVTAALSNNQATEGQLQELLCEHDLKLAWFQHERLVHLLVMFLNVLLFMIAFCLLLILEIPLLLVLVLLLGVMTAAYIFYYFRLENAVQRGYLLRDMISQSIQARRQEQLTWEVRPPTAGK